MNRSSKRRDKQSAGRNPITTALLFVALLLFMLAAGRFTFTLLHAGSITTALYSLAVNITNTGASDANDLQVPFPLSGAALIDGDFISADALNTHVHKGDISVPAMPPTNRINIEGVVQDVAGTTTEFTTEAQNVTANDVRLVPDAVSAGSLYFGCDNPCRIVTYDIGTAGAGTWTITYEYWDGAAFTALTNVDDQTTGFHTIGRNTVTWDMPVDWATRTTTGSAVTSFWGRARVSAFTDQTVAPLGTQVFYENGQWWTWVEALAVNNQEKFNLFLGGSTNLVPNHQLFPGTAGILTADAVTLEVTGAYSIGIIGRFDFSAAGATTCVLCKTSAYTINVSGSSSNPTIGTSFTGESTSTGDVTGITMPATGEQTLIIASDGTNAATFFGASAGGMHSYSNAGIYVDNGNNLTWVDNGGVDYFESIRMDSDAPTVYNFETSAADFATGTLTNTQTFTGALGLAGQ